MKARLLCRGFSIHAPTSSSWTGSRRAAATTKRTDSAATKDAHYGTLTFPKLSSSLSGTNIGDFGPDEWDRIDAELSRNSDKYGFPRRVYGSVVVGSFNIRNLGRVRNRTPGTWAFLGRVCRQFDLLAIQEVTDNMEGLNRLREEMEGRDGKGEWGMVVSDKTGTYPGDRGKAERLAFLYRTSVVERGEVVSDITFDRSKILKIILENLDEIIDVKEVYEGKMEDYNNGIRKTKPRFIPPTFLSFIRQPFCSSFSIRGFPGTRPYQFMAINAHLIFGTTKDRWREFEALMDWIRQRIEENYSAYYPNYMLLGDLNLNYDNPDRDFAKLERFLKTIEGGTGADVNVNFPFLDVHPDRSTHFTSNSRLNQRYDQIGFFFGNDGEGTGDFALPTFKENSIMGRNGERGPDYGVFNFTELFAVATLGKSYTELSVEEQRALQARFCYEVSDHFPIWSRLKLPDSN